MKRILKNALIAIPVLILIFVCISAGAVFAEEKKADADAGLKKAPHIVFKESVHDFGEVMQNARPKYTFSFKNTGKRKLVIEKVKAG